VSNQPPAPTTAPVNGANPAPTAGNSQQGTEEQTSKRESTTNFEVDKTVRVTRGSTGNVKRLSAAVVVNYQTAEDKGKPITKALTPEQLEQMTALVRETIGFNKERGDSVNLMNTPFLVDATPVNDTPLWKQPEVIDLAKTFAWPVGAVLFAALVLLGLVRPALKSGTAAKPQPVAAAGGQLDALESETPERPALPAPNKKDEVLPATPEQLRLDDARVLAKENPVAVANILKSWLNGDPA
jgi:flagellar M-ring protein FliF